MATTQTLLSTAKITMESARVLGNNTVLGKLVNRDYDGEYGVKGAKIGQTINIRKPIRPHGRVGAVVDINAINESFVPLSYGQPIGVDYAFTSAEMTFSIDDFSNRFIKPAMVSIANQIDRLGYLTMQRGIYNQVGTPGVALTKATAADAVLLAAAKLYENGAPIDDGLMSEINSPRFNATLSGGNVNLFNKRSEIDDIYVKGMMGDFGGFRHTVSQNVQRHTNGVFGGTPLVAGGGQSGTSLVTDGWSANSSLNVGDIFTIAGVFGVNMQTYDSTGSLQQFTVTEKSVTSGGVSTLQIMPAINAGPGGYQTVTALPADNAAITVLGASGGTYGEAFAFHRDALLLANTDLELPTGVAMASYQRDPDSGIGIRVVQAYDVRTDQFITRFDTMVAWGLLFPELAVRIVTD